MATSYEAVVRMALHARADGDRLPVEHLRRALPPEWRVETRRSGDDVELVAHLRMDANDASEVQIEAERLCRKAFNDAGLDGGAWALRAVDVRSSS